MKEEPPKVILIILNWNSWKDTVECLESVLKIDYSNFQIILIDNNSQDNSVNQILKWLNGKNVEIITDFPNLIKPYINKPVPYKIYKIINGSIWCNDKINNLNKAQIIFLQSDKNLGFAKANNVAIRFCQQYLSSSYIFLLNNDTVVKPDVLDHLVNVMEENLDVGVAQSTIYHYKFPNLIANAGAKIFFWGQTKYYKTINKGEIKSVDFINGCAMFIRSEVIVRFGALSEKYFFGEEDFEFSMRLKRKGIKMICIGNSVVFHKIGISSSILVQNKQNRKFLIFVLNRIVDMKDFYPNVIWHIWRIIALIYFFLLSVFRMKNSILTSSKIIYKVYSYTNVIIDVKKETIEPILSSFDF